MTSGRNSHNNKQFKEFLLELGEVLKTADKYLGLLQSQIPKDFFEEEPPLIASSFLSFITDNEDFETITILDKLSTYESVYQIYHDIRLASFINLNQLEAGTQRYIDIDRYYKFSTEFILRESFRLNLQLDNFQQKKQITDDDTDEIRTDFEELLSQDFLKITTSYSLGNAEAYYLITQNNVPVFSSLNQRSSLDERDTSLPDSLLKTEILPYNETFPVHTLSSISPQPTSRLPQQQAPKTEILRRFLHPNWYSLPTAKWLESSDLQSFAPVIDEQNTVVSSIDKGRLWLEQIGYSKLFPEEKKDESEESDDKGDAMDVDATQDVTNTQEVSEPQTEKDLGIIKLENIYEWSPGNIIDDDEIEAFENGTEVDLINTTLQKLQQARDERFENGNDLPSNEEIKLYHKAKRLLEDVVRFSDKIPDLKHSSSIPILQFDYAGTLPVPTQNVTKKKNKSRR